MIINLQPSGPCAHGTETIVTNLQPSDPSSHGTETIVTNLQPSDSCSHGTQNQEALIYNQVGPAHIVIKQ